MSDHTFRWNLPADYDEAEPEVRVTFVFHPGDRRRPRRVHVPSYDPLRARGLHDPDYDPPVVEDVQVFHIEQHPCSGSGGCDDMEITNDLPADVLAGIEAACWDHLPEKQVAP